MVKGKPKTDGESPDTKVAFDEVTIYEFPVDIGDNPAVREGCPIRLGDRLLRKSTIDVESYEKERSSARQRHAKKLYIDVTERATMLLSKGYSLDEIVAVVMETEALKKSRAESVKLNGREKLLFAMDSAGKTLRKIVGNGNKPQGPNSVQARMA
mmetsp:Transcript_86470/g.242086  ORF Transcript_86470/g.242086 Transcript_86470/m.242086 type:complete len:155 (-) Transcript_86470:80-544(-)